MNDIRVWIAAMVVSEIVLGIAVCMLIAAALDEDPNEPTEAPSEEEPWW